MNCDAESILVVDDEESWREMLSQFLKDRGFEVFSEANGVSAMERLASNQVDLVLLDSLMPEMDGLEVLAAIRKERSAAALPVIMATAKKSSREIVEALKQGANDYLTKPFDFPVVLARVQTHLSLKRSMDEVSRLQRRLEERNSELERANLLLTDANRKMKEDLEAAAKVQEAMLPPCQVAIPGLHLAWFFRPCDELAGDHLNIVPISDTTVSIFVLDVVGHGVPAALLAVTVNRVLVEILDAGDTETSDAESKRPRQIANHLSRLFSFDELEKYFTIVLCRVDFARGECVYTCAGHPGPIHHPKGAEPVIRDFPGFPIGIADCSYEEREIALQPGDRLILYSDGVVEAEGTAKRPFGIERILDVLKLTREASLENVVEALKLRLESWYGDCRQRDDISILALEIAETE